MALKCVVDFAMMWNLSPVNLASNSKPSSDIHVRNMGQSEPGSARTMGGILTRCRGAGPSLAWGVGLLLLTGRAESSVSEPLGPDTLVRLAARRPVTAVGEW